MHFFASTVTWSMGPFATQHLGMLLNQRGPAVCDLSHRRVPSTPAAKLAPLQDDRGGRTEPSQQLTIVGERSIGLFLIRQATPQDRNRLGRPFVGLGPLRVLHRVRARTFGITQTE